MPALPVIPATYLVSQGLLDSLQRHEFFNVMAVHDNTGVATESAIATKFAAQYQAHLMPFMSSAVDLGDTSVLALDGTSSTQTFVTPSAGGTGGHGTGNALPYAVALVIAWQTGLRGRSKRGRSYFPGVQDDMMQHSTTNDLTATQITAMSVGGNAFIAGLQGGAAPALSLGILSRVHGTFVDVINARADASAGVQRRRYEKVARH
jgi:hypothetical protein